ncbi:hypothetical protein [Rhodococcus sp. BE178]|uniref:hypothetical protein n=1 Tax=Rhodococcus sp. BE178 TaxID=2817737 RepID=UPI003D1BDD00
MSPVIEDLIERVRAMYASTPSGSGPATDIKLGTVKLAGDLGGTAEDPTVPGLAEKAPLNHTHTVEVDESEYSLDALGWRAVSAYERSKRLVRAGFGEPREGDEEAYPLPSDQFGGDVWIDLNTMKVWQKGEDT